MTLQPHAQPIIETFCFPPSYGKAQYEYALEYFLFLQKSGEYQHYDTICHGPSRPTQCFALFESLHYVRLPCLNHKGFPNFFLLQPEYTSSLKVCPYVCLQQQW